MESTIFFGNGFNNLSPNAKSWKDLLSAITTKEIIENIPNTLQYEDLYLADKLDFLSISKDLLKHSNEFRVKYKIAELVKNIETNEIYKQLISTNIRSFITTNYDYSLQKQLEMDGFIRDANCSDSTEKVYSIRRNHIYKNNNNDIQFCIRQIHGEVNFPQSIMLGYDHYCGSIAKISSYIKGDYEDKSGIKNKKIPHIIDRIKDKNTSIHSWIDLFFFNDIYIIGFGMNYAELDIWWLLNKRQRLIKEKKININNQIYCYNPPSNVNKFLLEDFGVKVLFENEKPNNQEEWLELYKRMLNDISKRI